MKKMFIQETKLDQIRPREFKKNRFLTIESFVNESRKQICYKVFAGGHSELSISDSNEFGFIFPFNVKKDGYEYSVDLTVVENQKVGLVIQSLINANQKVVYLYDGSECFRIIKPSEIDGVAFVNQFDAHFISVSINELKLDEIEDIKLFKYRQLYKTKEDGTIDCLLRNTSSALNGDFYLPKFNQLNDPFECLGYKEKDNNRIFSCAREYTNILLWVHYADCLKGICLEYSLKNVVKTIDETSTNSTIVVGDVRYVSFMPSSFFIKTLSILFNEQQIPLLKNIIYSFVKFKDWSYEREYRIFVDNTLAPVITVKPERYYFIEGRCSGQKLIAGSIENTSLIESKDEWKILHNGDVAIFFKSTSKTTYVCCLYAVLYPGSKYAKEKTVLEEMNTVVKEALDQNIEKYLLAIKQANKNKLGVNSSIAITLDEILSIVDDLLIPEHLKRLKELLEKKRKNS
ncbi:MAG: DUF2971 domain-containing protein [Bacilli bacterium]|nr:DUF2971 domain-containing protein [Bacilli bacterium]